MKVLLVSYFYPPMGGAGVQRVLKFSKYLPAFGIEPHVVAAYDPDYPQDETLLAEVPHGLNVLRVEHRTGLQRVLAWRRRQGGRSSAAAPALAAGALTARVRDAVLAARANLSFPDDRGGWARAAFAPALALVREAGIEMVVSSAPPVSAHALARRLARTSGLPWVADYRDLWADNPGYAAAAWRRALDRRTEARWLADAAGVTVVTPSWRERFERELGRRTPVAFIPNGYDEADFDGLQPVPRADGAFRLVHTGAFYGPRDPATLLDALARYLRAAPGGARPLKLRLVGSIGSRFDDALARFEADHPGVIERRPYVPHREALLEMLAADALLLVVGAGQGARHASVVAGTLPGKLFEYLRARRPVLLLGDEQGDAALLLRRHGRGWIADQTRPERIAECLQAMMRGMPPAEPAADAALFERRALAGGFAAFLRRCRRG